MFLCHNLLGVNFMPGWYRDIGAGLSDVRERCVVAAHWKCHCQDCGVRVAEVQSSDGPRFLGRSLAGKDIDALLLLVVLVICGRVLSGFHPDQLDSCIVHRSAGWYIPLISVSCRQAHSLSAGKPYSFSTPHILTLDIPDTAPARRPSAGPACRNAGAGLTC